VSGPPAVATGRPNARDLSGRAGDGAGAEVDLELLLGEHRVSHRGRRRSEHLDLALLHLLADLLFSIGRVAEDALRPPCLGLGVDEILGLWPSCSEAGSTSTAVISGASPLVAGACSL
jgi:hypothetical protein